MHAASILLLFGAFCQPAASFQPSSSTSGRFTSIQAARVSHHEADSNGIGSATTRRSFAEDLVKGSIGFSLANLASLPAYASGGATAGGAYLLSAKQRYNKRVLAGVKSFLTLDARNLNEVNAFFESTDEGGWEDLTAAGYLLANAFRTTSTKAPDALPSVKKWKAFAKEIELVKRALSKKDSEKVFTAYKSAEETLDAYLDAVELPSGMELKKM
ncbi:hypothetical protein ACHAWU_007909 [Discostella pseudostelligera]|uniref:Extrinsic protein in photosystem II n=1 Tax=Discostella pseudostelligera TaxID=259834 RepID=A0ABD3MAN3_9STRA